MSPTETFSLVNMITMIMWALMILLPKWKLTHFLVDYKLIPILLSIIYAIYIAQSLKLGGNLNYSSLTGVMKMFTQEQAILAGWIHYLVFDLLIGMWILNQSRSLKIHHLIIIPCLLSVFMLGPIGFLIFLLIRTIKLKIS